MKTNYKKFINQIQISKKKLLKSLTLKQLKRKPAFLSKKKLRMIFFKFFYFININFLIEIKNFFLGSIIFGNTQKDTRFKVNFDEIFLKNNSTIFFLKTFERYLKKKNCLNTNRKFLKISKTHKETNTKIKSFPEASFKFFFNILKIFFFWKIFWAKKIIFVIKFNFFFYLKQEKIFFSNFPKKELITEKTTSNFFFIFIKHFIYTKSISFILWIRLLFQKSFFERKKKINKHIEFLIKKKWLMYTYPKLKKGLFFLELTKGGFLNLSFFISNQKKKVISGISPARLFKKFPNKIEKIFFEILKDKFFYKEKLRIFKILGNFKFIDLGRKIYLKTLIITLKKDQNTIIQNFIFFEGKNANFGLIKLMVEFFYSKSKNKINGLSFIFGKIMNKFSWKLLFQMAKILYLEKKNQKELRTFFLNF
ncbi:hypothetical protein HAN_1g67 (nucleomorph) [Hemiselmis andersenii]|uniref:Uncharacterized protein n=2 Tax=Hemiselmis andersenii TaxID=464988 RepID=A9BK79_HEMAN|nr:hypothetical protein HAN_1g67 [Hemiselmis andersenii]ABW97912.1 hypothetical protein HAN_1g67 [Hemiselmis andersenii]